jgi:hypothetical protein
MDRGLLRVLILEAVVYAAPYACATVLLLLWLSSSPQSMGLHEAFVCADGVASSCINAFDTHVWC